MYTDLSFAYSASRSYDQGQPVVEIRCHHPERHIRPELVFRMQDRGLIRLHRVVDVVRVEPDQRRAIVRTVNL